MGAAPVLVWFHNDLRTADNTALLQAASQNACVIPVFIYAPDEEAPWAPGAASRWWLHHSLLSLDRDLRRLGSQLTIRTGPSLIALKSLIAETGANAVFWSIRHEPALIERDRTIENELTGSGITINKFNSALLFEVDSVLTRQGSPFQVFTPFWRACLALPEPAIPTPPPAMLPSPPSWPDTVNLDSLQLRPKVDWAGGLRASWQPGAEGAHRKLRLFLDSAFSDYPFERNFPGIDGTSRLSPHLHFGELSPRQLWHAVREAAAQRQDAGSTSAADAYLRQLGWREFAYHLLRHFPHTPDSPLKSAFRHFPSKTDRALLRAWHLGNTGYPLVDAGMRQLWSTGWMHNRARMIAASFLVKHLLIPWQEGARWFWDTLVDADLANNTLGWQWVAGCGADASPFFRIFNPLRQGQKFDPQGLYVRRWVSQLSGASPEAIHRLGSTRTASGGSNIDVYPDPIVDHDAARGRALAAFASLKSK